MLPWQSRVSHIQNREYGMAVHILPIFLMPSWATESCDLHQCLKQVGGSPVFISMGEPSLIPNSWNIWEIKTCPSPRQHNWANTVTASVDESAPKLWPRESCPYFPFGGLALELTSSRASVLIWPAPTFTPLMICWSTWRDLTHRPKDAGSPQHKMAVWCPWRL